MPTQADIFGLACDEEYQHMHQTVEIISARISLGKPLDAKEYAVFQSLLARLDELETRMRESVVKTNV